MNVESTVKMRVAAQDRWRGDMIQAMDCVGKTPLCLAITTVALAASSMAMQAPAAIADSTPTPASQPASTRLPARALTQAEIQFLAQQRQSLAADADHRKRHAPMRVDEVFTLSIVDGQINVEILIKDDAEELIVPLRGVEGVCTIQRQSFGVNGGNLFNLTVHVLDPARLQSELIQITSHPFGFNLNATVERPTDSMMAQLIVFDPDSPMAAENVGARLYLQESTETDQTLIDKLEVVADTPAQLFQENQDAVQFAFSEGFRQLRAVHLLAGLSDRQIEQLLAASAVVPAEVSDEIAAAVKRIPTDSAGGEMALTSTLDSAGPAGVAALMKLPRGDWSADLTMRIDTILARYMPDDPSSIELANREPGRLIDLLYAPNAKVRTTVFERLRALPSFPSDLSASFDAARDPYQQVDVIESLRSRLVGP